MTKILDCTLRDGGYINNWNFPDIKNIIQYLQKTGIDYIEAGFYHICPFDKLPFNCSNILLMIDYLKTPIEAVPGCDKSKIKGLRVIFKKHEADNALKYCAQIKEKGYKTFINATFTSQYKDDEFRKLLNNINEISPYCLTITDSMGVYTKNDIIKINSIIERELSPEIALCFHSHNNLGLSYSNAKTLIEINKNRELIIDATAFSMGRGAGNLASELLIEYLNSKGANYNLEALNEVIKKYIMPIYQKTPWGYSIPYYLSALNRCHPNYAKFLIDNKIELNRMDKIFSSIPNNKKDIYDPELLAKQLV
ncbi:hypothetical protein IJ531_04165 [bacterium]|nr:hypothetical protein [bacterium]